MHMSKKNMMKYTQPLHEYAAGHAPKGEKKQHELHESYEKRHHPEMAHDKMHMDRKQGYNDRLDESLAMKHPKKHIQDMKARRDESRGERHHMAAVDEHVRPY